MFKQHLLKLALGLVMLASLLGGVSASASSAAAAKVVPAQHLLACGGVPAFPPCD
jgi:hypothetical protein